MRRACFLLPLTVEVVSFEQLHVPIGRSWRRWWPFGKRDGSSWHATGASRQGVLVLCHTRNVKTHAVLYKHTSSHKGYAVIEGKTGSSQEGENQYQRRHFCYLSCLTLVCSSSKL
eukprot:3987817-Pleurochrysis_carterae.AAC.1